MLFAYQGVYFYKIKEEGCFIKPPLLAMYRPILKPSGLFIEMDSEIVELTGSVNPLPNAKNAYVDDKDNRFRYLIKGDSLSIYFCATSGEGVSLVAGFENYITQDTGLYFAKLKAFVDADTHNQQAIVDA